MLTKSFGAPHPFTPSHDCRQELRAPWRGRGKATWRQMGLVKKTTYEETEDMHTYRLAGPES